MGPKTIFTWRPIPPSVFLRMTVSPLLAPPSGLHSPRLPSLMCWAFQLAGYSNSMLKLFGREPTGEQGYEVASERGCRTGCAAGLCVLHKLLYWYGIQVCLYQAGYQLAVYHNAEQPLSVCTNMFTQYNYNDVDSWFFSVNVSAKRVGGAYGAKITRGHLIAAACGLGAYITKRYSSVPRFNL